MGYVSLAMCCCINISHGSETLGEADERLRKRMEYVEEKGSEVADEYRQLINEGLIAKPILRANIYPKLAKTYFTDDKAQGTSHIAPDLSNPKLNEKFNRSILLSYPLYYNKDKTPNARSSIFLFTKDETNHVFLLFSKTAKSEKTYKSDCFTDFAGSVQLKLKDNESNQQEVRPENWLEAIQRIVINQSGELCRVDSKNLLEKSYTFFRQSTNDRQIVIVFMPIPYLAPEKFKAAVAQNQKEYAKVKDAFVWINVQSILDTLPILKNTIEEKKNMKEDDTSLIWENLESKDGQKLDLRVRAYVADILGSEETKKILHHLMERNKVN